MRAPADWQVWSCGLPGLWKIRAVAMTRPRTETGAREWRRLRLPADMAAVAGAAGRVAVWARARGAGDDETDAIRLGLTEALNNAAEHGGKLSADDATPVELEWSWEGEWLDIVVSEPGEFEPGPEWAELPADDRSEDGRGGFLIHSTMDEVTHRNAGGRHSLHMRKRLGPARPPASAAVAELERTLDAMMEELSGTYENLAALFHFSELLATAPTPEEFFQSALEKLGGLVQSDALWVRVADAGGLRLLNGTDAGGNALAAVINDKTTVESRVLAEGVENTVESRARLPAGDPLRAGDGSAFVCPLSFQSKRVGVLVVVRAGGDRGYFTAGQLALVRMVADFMGIARVNVEMQEERRRQQRTLRELEIARQIQASLLPTSFPVRADWAVHGVCVNAAEVGGDFFDVREVPGRGVLLVVADVMGKGVPAALLATVLRTAAQARAPLADSPGPLLTEINAQLAPDLARLEMFITALVLFLPEGGGAPSWASAGHGAPLAPRTDDDGGGVPLGVLSDAVYETRSLVCAPGGLVVLATDGLTEAADADGHELGAEGVAAAALANEAETPAQVCGRVMETVRIHTGGRPASDDRTLLVARRLR